MALISPIPTLISDHCQEDMFVMISGYDRPAQRSGVIRMRHRQSPAVSSSCLENGSPLALTPTSCLKASALLLHL